MSNNDGLLLKAINLISINIANDIIDAAERKVNSSKLSRTIQDKFNKDKMHKEAKEILSIALSDAQQKTLLPKQCFNPFLNDNTNRTIIKNWILEDIKILDDSDIDKFNIKEYAIKTKEDIKLKTFIKNIFNSIIKLKPEKFSAAHINILNKLDRLESKINHIQDNLGNIINKLDIGNEDFIESLSNKIIQGIADQPYVTQKTEQISANIDFNSELKIIKKLIDNGDFETAEKEGKKLYTKIYNTQLSSNQPKFLINAYLSQIYLNSTIKNKKSIPYLNESIKYAKQKYKRERNNALLLLVQKKYNDALTKIDDALGYKPNDFGCISIKSEILINLGLVNEYKNLFKNNILKKNPEYHFKKAYFDFKIREFDSAYNTAIEALKKKKNISDLYLLISEILYEKIRIEIDKTKSLLNIKQETIKECIDNINKYLANSSIEMKERRGIALAKRGLLYSWSQNFDLAIKDLESAIILIPSDPIILKNLALFYWEKNNFLDALNCINHIIQIFPKDKINILIKTEILIAKGDVPEAIAILQNEIKSNRNRKLKLKMCSKLVDAFDRNLQTTKAESILDEFIKKFGLKPELLLSKAKHLKRLGKVAKSATLLEKNISKFSSFNKILSINILGDLYFEMNEIHDYHKASKYYESICSTNMNDSTFEKYIHSLFFSNQYSKCLSLCKEAQEIHGFIETCSEIEAAIYANLNNFIIASEIYKTLSRKYPGNIGYLINYAKCVFRLGKNQEAIDTLLLAESKIKDSSSDLSFIGYAYASIHDYNKALKYSLKALQSDPANVQLHYQFIGIFFSAENYLQNIDKKFIDKFQDVTQNFKSRFPDEKGFFIKEFSKNPDEMKKQISEMLTEKDFRRHELESEYTRKKFPIGFLSVGMGTDILTTWAALTVHPTLKIYTSQGILPIHQIECSNARRTKEIIIDIISLLLIHMFDLFENLTKKFNIIYVCQSAVDALTGYIQLQEISIKKGFMSVWAENGEIYRQEIPKESIDSNVNKIKNILNSITNNKNVKIIGKSNNINQKIDIKLQNRLNKVIGAEQTDVIIESSLRDKVLYSDDWGLRNFAEQKLNIKHFSSRALLDVLLEEKLIEEKKYHHCVIDLIQYNYHFISISTQTLYFITEEMGFTSHERAFIAFNSLRSSDHDLPMLLNFSISYLRVLWQTNLNPDDKSKWTDILLNSITFKRNASLICDHILKRKNEILPYLVPPGIINHFEFTINTWLKANKY